MLDWLFRSRETGRITIAQRPNIPLGIWIAAEIVHRLFGLPHGADRVVSVVGTVALVVWALDEVVRGVNPWRRLLGAGALLSVLLP